MLAFIALCLAFTGCSLIKTREQTRLIDNTGIIKGKVTISGARKGPIIVLRYYEENGTPILVSKLAASEKGDYKFNVTSGTYYLAAFVDLNNDQQYQKNEPGNFFGAPDQVLVSEGKTINLEPIVISGPLPATETENKAREDILKIIKNIGVVTSLEDPTFSSSNYYMGMWHPIDFLEKVGGGLFFLQPYQSGKVPVLFVHGINGGPTDWQAAITSLDKDKFQPWVLYYPSGFKLDIVSDYLVQAIVSLQKRYGFSRINVAAHSMGGLIVRSFTKKYREQYPEISKNLTCVITVNSPMGGMSSATTAVNFSPIVISSWEDVASDSAFLQNINNWEWPEEITYHLFFSFKTGFSGDGVVSLESQIPMKLQAEATSIHGFNNDHLGTLNDPYFLKLFNDLLTNSLKR